MRKVEALDHEEAERLSFDNSSLKFFICHFFRLIYPRSHLHEDVDMHSIRDLVKICCC